MAGKIAGWARRDAGGLYHAVREDGRGACGAASVAERPGNLPPAPGPYLGARYVCERIGCYNARRAEEAAPAAAPARPAAGAGGTGPNPTEAPEALEARVLGIGRSEV